MIPGRFGHLYVQKKDELLATHLTPFAALSAFLDDKVAPVQQHMLDKLIEGALKEPHTQKDLKKNKDLKAKIEVRTNDKPTSEKDKPAYNK